MKQQAEKPSKRTDEEKLANLDYTDALPTDDIHYDFMKDSEIKNARREQHANIGRRTMQFFSFFLFAAIFVIMGILQVEIYLKS